MSRTRCEDPLQADSSLCTRQWPAGAGVHSSAERHMCSRVDPVDPELGRAFEAPGITVCGTVQKHDRRAGGDVHPADRGRPPRQAEVRLHRALDAQCLFDEVGDLLLVLRAAGPVAPGCSARYLSATASRRAVVS